MLKKLKKVVKDPKLILEYLLDFRIFRVLPDELYLKIKYRIRMGEILNLTTPETFNEKLHWLKLYAWKPEYTRMVDKYEVRNYIKEMIGEGYSVPLLGVYDSFEDVDFDMLPNEFVLKPNHTSGNIFICKDKSKIDYKKLKKEVNRWLKRKYYWFHRERPYKNVKPRILCEKYLVDELGQELKDYKVFCFNGVPGFIQVDFNKSTDYTRNLYDPDWNYIPVTYRHPTDPNKLIMKPTNLEEMLEIAEKLSRGFPFLRIDFFNIHQKLYITELTFYPEAGFGTFEPETYNYKFGSWIKLPNKLFKD